MSSKKYCSCNTKKTCVVLVLRLALRLVKMSRMDSWSYLQYLKTPTIYLFEICRCSYLYLLYLYLHRSYIFRFTKDFLDLYIQVYFWLVDDHIFLIYIFVLIFFFFYFKLMTWCMRYRNLYCLFLWTATAASQTPCGSVLLSWEITLSICKYNLFAT